MSDRAPRYQLLEVLGEGGFGVVYRARVHGGQGFQKDVAVKVLRDGVPDSALARFRDEARILGLLRDRTIVAADPPIRIDGRWALVMELVEGASLASLRQRGPLPESVAVEVVGEVARALDVAWRHPGPDGPLHLLHRDLKPSNVQLTRTGQVKLLDFGTARADLDREAHTTRLTGTPRYIAPERLRGQEGPEGDVYSLGILLGDLVDAPSEPVAALISSMTGDPSDRPTAREVERTCDALRDLPGPRLRDWAETHVPATPPPVAPTEVAPRPRRPWVLLAIPVALALAWWARPVPEPNALRQPFLDFVMAPNASTSERTALRSPEAWDDVLFRDVATEVAEHATEETWRRLDQVWATWAEVVEAARAHGLPEVVGGQAWVESQYTPELQSSMCAKGLWQFMPESAVAMGLRVRGCRFVDDPDARYDPPPVFLPDRPYLGDGCRIPARLGCEVDERTDVAASTSAAMDLFEQPFDDRDLRASGAVVQLMIASHMAGYAPNPRNVRPGYLAWSATVSDAQHPYVYGAAAACDLEPGCTPALDTWVRDGVARAIAAHFLAVCYYGKNYADHDAFHPWEKYADGYCRTLDVPHRSEVAAVPTAP